MVQTYGYFNVTPSPLTAKVIDGISSVRTIGTDPTETFLSDPMTFSINPNVEANVTGADKIDRFSI